LARPSPVRRRFASAFVLTNGDVLCAVGPKTSGGPTSFVEYTPVANKLTEVSNEKFWSGTFA